MTDLKTQLEKAFEKADLIPKNIEPYIKYIKILKEWNRNIALISKREESIIDNLLVPSLLFFKLFNCFNKNNPSVVDVGSGAGFPAIPIKIYNPSIPITMIEANTKKSAFLRYVCANLHLDCTIINKRVEKLKKPLACDVITVRALNIKDTVDNIQEKIKSCYLVYFTSKDGFLNLHLKNEVFFKKHWVKLYSFAKEKNQ